MSGPKRVLFLGVILLGFGFWLAATGMLFGVVTAINIGGSSGAAGLVLFAIGAVWAETLE